MVRTELILYWSYGFAQEIHPFETNKSHEVNQMLKNVEFRGIPFGDQDGRCLRGRAATADWRPLNSIFLN
jgi:hypothetical protein